MIALKVLGGAALFFVLVPVLFITATFVVDLWRLMISLHPHGALLMRALDPVLDQPIPFRLNVFVEASTAPLLFEETPAGALLEVCACGLDRGEHAADAPHGAEGCPFFRALP